jgi:6-phosphogluconolactonase
MGELPPSEAADRYEATIRRVLGARDAEEPPAELFDLVLLGMGVDGHTASLFPGNSALDEQVRWALDTTAPKGVEPSARVTLTLPVLNAAKRVLFLAAGMDKVVLLDRIRNEPDAVRAIPAAMVRGVRETVWHIAETA